MSSAENFTQHAKCTAKEFKKHKFSGLIYMGLWDIMRKRFLSYMYYMQNSE